MGNVTLNSSDMTFMCPTDVWGNWKGGNSVIKVPAVTKNYDGTENGADIALNIQNVASEAATITTVDPDNYQELKEPQLGDNYVVGLKAEGSVKTGDSANLILWGVLLIISGIGGVVLLRRMLYDRNR